MVIHNIPNILTSRLVAPILPTVYSIYMYFEASYPDLFLFLYSYVETKEVFFKTVFLVCRHFEISV